MRDRCFGHLSFAWGGLAQQIGSKIDAGSGEDNDDNCGSDDLRLVAVDSISRRR